MVNLAKSLPYRLKLSQISVVKNVFLTGVRKKVPYWCITGKWFAPLSILFHSKTRGAGKGFGYVNR
jgi:hypothetical protein